MDIPLADGDLAGGGPGRDVPHAEEPHLLCLHPLHALPAHLHVDLCSSLLPLEGDEETEHVWRCHISDDHPIHRDVPPHFKYHLHCFLPKS